KMTSTRQTMTQEAPEDLISQRVADALATYDANRNNRDDSRSHNSRSGGRRTVHSTLKGIDVESYTQHFQELVLLCSRMVPDESDKVEMFTGGLPKNIQGSVMASKPKILQEAIELAKSLIDQKVRAYADRQADNKRRMYNNSRDNYAQQLPYK
ncbi:hypothetical protein Tco_0107409, partial [Tanacetum coccineum]